MIDRIHQWSHLVPDIIFDYRFSLFVCVCLLSHFSRVHLFATLWTVACQVSLSMGFSRQENWSGLPCPPPWNLPHPGIKPRSPTLQADCLPAELPGKPFSLLISNLFVTNLSDMRQVLGPGALGSPRGIGWRGRWEGGMGWGTHVNPWLIQVNVWQKP